MKLELTKDWCLRMAQLELEVGSNIEAGTTLPLSANSEPTELPSATQAGSNVAFGRLISLMRRHRRLTVERLAETADLDITEVVEIEMDSHHTPGPRTVYQLAKVFDIPTPKLMQLAGLSAPRDSSLFSAATKFAARSESVEDLNEIERAALEAFVSVLNEK